MPGVYDGRGKAFFFYNYEQLRLPNNVTRTRVVATPEALGANFRYTVSGQVRSVNVLDVAARNGRTTTLDPDVARVLGRHPGGDGHRRACSTRGPIRTRSTTSGRARAISANGSRR